MKFETYKKLTDAERMEWDFRFRKITYPRASLGYAVMLYLTLSTFAALSIVIINQYAPIKMDILYLVQLSSRIAVCIVWIWLLDYVGQVLLYAYRKYKEHKWMKSRVKK